MRTAKDKSLVSGEGYAVLAAALYALSTPFAKVLLNGVSSTLLAALLYLGAGIGVGFIVLLRGKEASGESGKAFERADAPYIFAMIMLDIAAPILLFLGLSMSTAETVSLLNNFEIAATSVIAWLLFSEAVSGRLWVAIAFITLGSMLLSADEVSCLSFSYGSLLALAACLC